MLAGLTILLLFQCAGEVIVPGLGLRFPGPVPGMLLPLAAVFAIATGIIGAVSARFTFDAQPPFLRWCAGN
jgi:putative effector of murein hydrolase LrgA (UPF0299 family)